jgi:hypothetical protein
LHLSFFLHLKAFNMAPLFEDVLESAHMMNALPITHDDDSFADNDEIMMSVISHDSTACFAPLHQQPEATPINRHRRCRVWFGVPDTVHDVLHRSDYTPLEITLTWFDRVDLRQMKDAVKIEARLLDRGVLAEGDDVTIRGLESRTRDGARRKRAHKLHAYTAVFMELETQLELGIRDEDALADVYYELSEQCQAAAQMLAARDAKDVYEAETAPTSNHMVLW